MDFIGECSDETGPSCAGHLNARAEERYERMIPKDAAEKGGWLGDCLAEARA